MYKYTFTKANGARVVVHAETLPDAIRFAGMTEPGFTYIREPEGNDEARAVVVEPSEVDQLKARVQELEEFIDNSTIWQGVSGRFGGFVEKDAVAVLHRTPAQSLLLHDAEVLEWAADKFESMLRRKLIFKPVDELRGRAAQLRKQAEGE